MLPGDRDLVARDPQLRGLAIVLDDDALTDVLAARWPGPGPRPDAVRVTYLRYKPATSLLATVRVVRDGQATTGLLVATAPDASAKIDKLRRHAHDHPGDLPVVDDTDHGVLLAPITADRHLRGCRRLAARLGEIDSRLAGGEVSVLSYKPHRRLVARLAHDGVPTAVVKVHRRDAMDEVTATLRWATAVASHRLALPRLIGTDPDHGIAVTTWLPGTALDAHDPDRRRATLRAVGKLLGRLHRADPAGLPATPPRPEVPSVIAAIDQLRPDLTGRARAALAGTTRSLNAPTPVHGDLTPDQVVHGSDGVGLIDLDRTAVGAPATDLASWIAEELVQVAPGAGDVGPPEPLLEGYRSVGGPATDGDVAAALPFELLRRATDPFRSRSSDWHRRMTAIVEAATGLHDMRVA